MRHSPAPDVLVARLSTSDELWLNDGSGKLSNSRLALGQESTYTYSVATADLEGDGDLDILLGGKPEERLGASSEALRTFKRFRQRLQAELGETPSASRSPAVSVRKSRPGGRRP